jgi:beta-glucosidase
MKYFFKSIIRMVCFFTVMLWSLFISDCFSGEFTEAMDYKNPSLSIEKRIEDLLSRMTVEEKVAQLECQISESPLTNKYMREGIGGLGCMLRPLRARQAAERLNQIQKFMLEKTRLGIPIIMHDEALHGLLGTKATSFPQSIALASMWDPDFLYQVAEVIALETKSRGIRQVLSPTINMARDVRWGRTEETYGEDPYLTSRLAVAFVSAFEKNGIITTPKHYAANIGDGGRDSNPIHFSERIMREIYLPVFKACIREANATSIMAAYNSFDGTPCSSNRWLLTDLLRGEWGFKGFVVSDYGSVSGIYNMHHTAVDSTDCARQALEAGLDVELPYVTMYGKPLLKACKEGLVPREVLDQAVRRVLSAKFRLGLFENPYADPTLADKLNDSSEHRKLALVAARRSVILLKNENQTLPFDKGLKSIAVVGPLANIVKLGGYSGSGMATVSVLDGIKKVLPSAAVYFARGAGVVSTYYPIVPAECLVAGAGNPEKHGLKGEYFNNMSLSGKPDLVRIDQKVDFYWGSGSPDPLIQSDKFSIRWTGKLVSPVTGRCKIIPTTDDGVRLYIDNKQVDNAWYDRGATSDFIDVSLVEGQTYDVKIEYYDNGGDAYAALGWDIQGQREDDSDIQEAVDVAKKAQATVIVVGVNEGEGRDRANIGLTPKLEKLILSVSELGKPTAVVLINGSAISMEHWIESVDAILEAWYPGEEGGNAIADVLFGNVNPGGKLPITFPVSVGQCPLFYNTKPTGRGYDYVDMSGRPLFPFGHGLSYTTFEFSNLKLSSETVKPDQSVSVSLDVRNSGLVKGDEVAQLYIHDVIGSVSRPLKELKGFKRVTLEPGEKKTVELLLTPEHLSMYNREMKWVVEPGTFEILVGCSSSDIKLKANLEVVQ